MTNEELAVKILDAVDEGKYTYQELLKAVTNLLNEEL